MILKQKRYGYLDMITLALKTSPFYSIIFLMRNILDALLPTISIFATAYFLNTAISIFNQEAELSAIYLSIALLIGIMLYQALIGRLMKFIDCKRKIYYRCTLVNEVFEKIAKLEYRYIENSNTADLINRIVPNLESKIWEMYVESLGLINLVVYVSGVLVALFLQIWWLPLTIMVFSLPLMYIAKKAGQQSYNANRDMTKIDRTTNYLSEVMKSREAMEERNVYGYLKELNKQFLEQYYFARKHRLKIELMNSIKTKSSGLIITLYSIGIILVLLPVLKDGRMTVGMFIALIGAIFGLVTRLSQGLNITIQKFVGYREYLKDLTEYLLLDEQPGATALPCKKINFHTIEFKDVCFKYPGTDKQILNKVSFVIENGKHYSFVGVNGAGKTTITKLITGLYTDFEGQILIDGRSIRDFSQSEIKGLSSVVYQDFAKYYLTLYDNIAIADLSTDDNRKRIEDAIQLVGLSDVVGKLNKPILYRVIWKCVKKSYS